MFKELTFFLMAFVIIGIGLSTASADEFTQGKIIEDYGKIADLSPDTPLPKGVTFKVAFDLAETGEPGQINRRIDSLARFLNMHTDLGVDPSRINLAMVVHGPATIEMTQDTVYGREFDGAHNANAHLIAKLMEHGVRFYVCGQSAAYRGISKKDLLPGVTMSLSAMTEHALLQQNGYTLNPF